MKRNNLLVVVIALIVAGVAFLASVNVGPVNAAGNDPHLNRWLELSGDQIKAIDQADPTFDKEAVDLAQVLTKARSELATMLENDDATDEQILEQVEATIQAHNALERRVAQHLLKIRGHLEPAQRGKLMGMCAQGVRAGQRGQHRFGRDQSSTDHDEMGSGPHSGRGPEHAGPPSGRGRFHNDATDENP